MNSELEGNSIKYLPSDCLIAVFNHLSVLDRLKAELVCHKWHSLMPYGNITSINIMSLPFSSNCFNEQFRFVRQNNQSSEKHKVLKSFQLRKAVDCLFAKLNKLKTLQFVSDHPSCVVTYGVIDTLVKLCPRLEKLHFGSGIIIVESALIPLKYLQLKSFLIHDCIFLDSNQLEITDMRIVSTRLSQVFEKWKLIELDLTFYSLHSLPTISSWKLIDLNLDFTGVNDMQLVSMINSCRNLIRLSLMCCNNLRTFKPIVKLRKLETLILDDCRFVTDKDIREIRRNCVNLLFLSTNDCGNLSQFDY